MSAHEDGMREASKVDNASTGSREDEHPCGGTGTSAKHSWNAQGICSDCEERCPHDETTDVADYEGRMFEVCVECNADVEDDDGDRAYDAWKDDRLERGL